jgi:chromosome segregation ATPase
MELEDYKKQVEAKDKIIQQLKEGITQLEKKMENYSKTGQELESNKTVITTLQDSLKLKDNQLETIKDSLKLKDDQIKILESNLETKDSKINTLEKTLKLREDEIKSISSSTVHESVIKDKDQEIEELKKKIEILNDELAKSDEDLDKLEITYEKLKESGLGTTGSKIIDFTEVEITKTEILKEMREILQKALHNVTIAVPKIDDLQELYLYEVRSSVNMKISSEINPGLEEHLELLDEYESLDNINLRNFEGCDRYIINRDGEELLMGIIGKNENNHLVFMTRDSAHIKLLSSLVMESWLRSRKL